MIEEARGLSTLQAYPHELIFPGLAIALTVLAFNFIAPVGKNSIHEIHEKEPLPGTIEEHYP